jgi:hypothetical protein
MTLSLPEFNLKKQKYSSWEFHVDNCSESSSTYDMIIGRDLFGKLGIIMNSITIRSPGILCDSDEGQ